MAKLKKIISSIILGAIILYSGYLVGYWTKYYIYQYKISPERIYKQDTFGGKTPQETYEMFISALKSENLELASKYFILSKQSEKLKDFQETRDKGELQKYIEGLPEWGEMEERERIESNLREFSYNFVLQEPAIDDSLGIEIKFDAGKKYASSIIFKLNSFTNIWKIEIL